MIYYGFLLFIVLEYVRPGSFIPGLDVLHLNLLVPLGVIIATFVTGGPVSLGDVAKQSNTKVILLLLTLIVLSVLTADVTLYSFEIFKTVLGYVFVYWVIAKQITDLRKVKGVFFILVFVHAVLAALTPQMFTDPDARHYLSSGTFLGDGNDYALSVNVAIPFCLFLLNDASTKRHKLLYGGLLLLLVLCVVATKSRGGTLALACVGFYYWLKTNRKLLTSALAVVAITIVLIYAPPSYFERMGTISSHQDGSSQGRLAAWTAGTMMALDNPLLGVGAGHFPVKFGVEYRPKNAEQMPWLTAHSIFFLVLGELGFPGIGALLFFFGSNFVANRRLMLQLAARPSPESTRHVQLLGALSASLLAYGVAGAFLSAAYYPHMFVLGGLLVAGRRVAALALREAVPDAPAAPALACHPAMSRAVVVSRRPQPL